jgi:hypothetical protein
VTVVGDSLALEVVTMARDDPARAVLASFFPGAQPPLADDDPAQLRASGPGAAIAVVREGDASWLRVHQASSAGSHDAVRTTAEFVVTGRPHDGVLPLLVAWPAAGLADVLVELPLGTP